MMNGVLLDCDYIIALSIHTETAHARAKALHNILAQTPRFTLRIVSYELATVLSRKYSHQTALELLDIIKKETALLDIDAFEHDIWSEFNSHSKKSTSFFDCANLVAAKHYGFKIASFDAFYPKALLAA